jgi:hypothetical protein
VYPTRHWSKLQGLIANSANATIAHGLRDGRNGTAITPDVVEFEMGLSTYDTWPNENIGKWAPEDTTNIYLRNFDMAQGTHRYSVVARSFYSEDDVNF